jgi:dUTP pyrophosphatase
MPTPAPTATSPRISSQPKPQHSLRSVRQAVRTGLALELPSTHGALIEDRSGLALRGITTLAGVIDPGYRGELKIVLTNLAAEPQVVAPGHRIAQLRVVERIQASFEETDMLAETPRNSAGFGSTGV